VNVITQSRIGNKMEKGKKIFLLWLKIKALLLPLCCLAPCPPEIQ
jgi:hypothetical protein